MRRRRKTTSGAPGRCCASAPEGSDLRSVGDADRLGSRVGIAHVARGRPARRQRVRCPLGPHGPALRRPDPNRARGGGGAGGADRRDLHDPPRVPPPLAGAARWRCRHAPRAAPARVPDRPDHRLQRGHRAAVARVRVRRAVRRRDLLVARRPLEAGPADLPRVLRRARRRAARGGLRRRRRERRARGRPPRRDGGRADPSPRRVAVVGARRLGRAAHHVHPGRARRALWLMARVRRSRRPAPALELLDATLPELRRGLTASAARTVAYELFEKLGYGAVAVTDRTAVLAFVGAGADHHGRGDTPMRPVYESMTRGEPLLAPLAIRTECGHPACPLGAAAVVPLQLIGGAAGAVVAYSTDGSPLDESAVDILGSLGRQLSAQLQLSELHAATSTAL